MTSRLTVSSTVSPISVYPARSAYFVGPSGVFGQEKAVFVGRVWETPWTRAHGHAGMLYRGHYLDQALVRGMRLAIDAQWLERCPAGRPQDVKQ